jgi:hypothetical protein
MTMVEELEKLLKAVLNGSVLHHTGTDIWIVGIGYGSEPGCCGHFRRDGSCCGNAVETQVETQVQIRLAVCDYEEVAALIVAAINALPGLLESARRVERLEAALKPFAEARLVSWGQRTQGVVDFLTSVWINTDPNKAVCEARAALKGT